MKFSINWLREFIELPANVDELANLLTLAGIEIEGIEKRGANFDQVIVAQITASSQHPNADRLSVCQVDDGSGKPRQIVCGAKNYKVNDKVPLALPGAVLPNDLKIKSSKLRGVESDGMLCSGIELGLSEDSDGLLILSPEAKVGTPIAFLFPDDTILDVEITPNRGDLISHFGLAREISALSGKPLRAPNQLSESDAPTRRGSGINISAPLQSPFYSARRIENVQIGPSPEWLRTKLEAVGLRSINNIVDITNFVMLELGQPLHAFDADKLIGNITVRLASTDEKFLALDGKTYSLGPYDLVIADAKRAVGIAGVMGGEDTGVTNATKNVLLEAAYFRPGSVRRTARSLNLLSDSSYRFERGVDPGMILPASQRATTLICEIAGGKAAPEIDLKGELPSPPTDVSLRYERCNRLIGVTIPQKRTDQILEGFGLKKIGPGSDAATWRIPSHRRDLQREQDLIEEVVRVYGIEKVPVTDRSRYTESSSADRIHDLEAELRLRLAGRGLNEARTSKLIPRISPAFNENAVELRNPLSEDHVALRPSLIGGLLSVLERNIRAGAESVALFELGRVFIPPNADEERRLAVLFWGETTSEVQWNTPRRRFDFSDAKGAIESAFNRRLSFRRAELPAYALAAEIYFEGESEKVGVIGQLSAFLTAKIGAMTGVFVAEVTPEFSLGSIGSERLYREFGKFPAIKRDISMIAPENLTNEKIMDEMWSAAKEMGEAGEWLTHVQLFDRFLQEEKKSLAYTLTYRDKKRTLTTEEITTVHDKIRERLKRELGVDLRE
jgi:phenylalanyl-tRNA synthetase beta chain